MFYRPLHVVLVLCICPACPAQAELTRAIDHVVIEGAKIPFGTVVEIEGQGTEIDTFMVPFGAAALRALRIDGKPSLDKLEFYLCPGEEDDGVSREQLARIKKDAYYIVRGRLMDARFCGAENACTLVVEKFEATRERPLELTDFVDREANFDGTAAPGGKFKLGSDTATVEGLAGWPTTAVGKQISIRGVVRRDPNGWRIDNPTWKLIRLEDMAGQDISLEGSLWSLNGKWWFSYRAAKLFLTSPAGPTMVFRSDDHGRPVRVTGQLVRQERPSLSQISRKSDRDLVPGFVVRGAKVDYLERKYDREQRFGTVYRSFHTVRDGVPELLAESSFRRNLMGNETKAMLFLDRNRAVIEATLEGATVTTRDILVQRMADSKLAEPLRLLYAAMLAGVNDERGRSFLIKMAEARGDAVNLDALYCLGVFPFIAPPVLNAKVEIDWAEETMIALMKDRNRVALKGVAYENVFGADRELSVAKAAVFFTSIPSVLAMIDSNRSRNALLDYIIEDKAEHSRVIGILFSAKTPLPLDDLLKLEAVTKDTPGRRAILLEILRHSYRGAIPRFLGDLENDFVYMDLRDHLSPELLVELQPLVGRLTGEPKTHLQMLMVLGQKDPVPALLSLLTDPKWTDKNLVLFELSRLADARAVGEVARVLRDSPKDYFPREPESNNTAAVQHALNAIAHTGTAEAIRELIGLLSVDLARFGTYIDRAGFQRIVAAHLIELTGESFGIDADKWKQWQQMHPTHRVDPDLANPRSVFRTNAGNAIDLGN